MLKIPASLLVTLGLSVAAVADMSERGAVQLAQGARGGGMGPGAGDMPDAETIMRRMDHDRDGHISAEEFRGPAHRFPILDADGDGLVSLAELRAGVARRGDGPKLPAPPAAGPLSQWYARLPIILTHTHFDAGFRRRRGAHEPDWDGAAANALEQMDEHGIRAAIVMSPPRPKSRGDDRDLDRLAKVVAKHTDRLLLAGGGESLNGTIQATNPNKVSDKVRRKFAARADEIVSKGAVGFGETTALHFSFFDGHAFEETSPDHPLFLLLADLAAEHGVPLDIHMEAVTQAWPVSRELHELGSANPDRVGENIAAFERLLAHNRDAKIVWVHLGIDSTGQRTVALMRRLLMTHPNLYVSITGAQARARLNRLFVAGVGLDPAWRKLIVEYPDRFMIGSDQFFQSDRPARRWPPFIEPAIRIVRTPGALPPEVARKVAFENAQRVFGLDLLRVDDVPLPADGQQSLGARSTPAPATAGQAMPAQAEMLGPRGLTARQVVANSDQDGDDRISRDEFRGPPPAFPRIDADGDGLLTREELEAFWRRRGLGSTGG